MTAKIKQYDLKTWAHDAGIRAIKTMAQTAVGLIGSSLMISEVSWATVASASVLAGVVSILTSVAGLPETDAKTNLLK